MRTDWRIAIGFCACTRPCARRPSSLPSSECDRQDEEIADYLEQAWHLRRWRRIAAEAGLDAEWDANSYRDGALDLYGTRRSLVIDTRLHDAVRPWIRAAQGEAIATDLAPTDRGRERAAASRPSESVMVTAPRTRDPIFQVWDC